MHPDDMAVVALAVWQNAVLAGAGAGLFGMLCRVDALRYRAHRLSIVLMHVALGIGCVWAGRHALAGEADVVDAAVVAAALSWITASAQTWRGGVPAAYSTAPTPLDEAAHATHPPAA